MATLKHINSKNADYGAAEQYLLFEHDEFTMKPVLDETGRLIPREDYRLSTLNCDGEDFAVACMRANLRYEKNQRREDVKSHHYIISFSLMCHWFRVAVLPLDGELSAALLCRGSRKRCAVCGAAFVPKSNRGKYCPDCAGRMKKIKAAERKRKQRQRCHALEPFKPA